MKNIALIAASLALLSTGATAQDAQSSAKAVKVINGSVITLYSLPASEWAEKGFNVFASGGVTVDSKSSEYKLEGGVIIELGQNLKIYAEKATVRGGENTFIVLQSDGRIESNEGEHKVTQFASEGTRIELP